MSETSIRWPPRRVDVELFVRWLQEARTFGPTTVSRAPVGCDLLLPHLCHPCRPWAIRRGLTYGGPWCRPIRLTLGLSYLQFEAMIVAARTSINPFDSAPVAMLGLLGLRIFEACAAKHRRPRRGTRPPRPARVRQAQQAQQGCPSSATASRRPGDRPSRRRPSRRVGPAQPHRRSNGPPGRDPAIETPASTRRRTDAENAPAHAAPR